MKENLIIEMSNGIKYAVIDAISCKGEQYFLVSQTSKDETYLSEEFEIVKYDKINNNLDQIEYEDELEYIKSLFDQRIQQNKVEFSIISKIDYDELRRLEVVSVKGYDYKLKYEDRIINKNIEFYSKTKPKKGDFLLVSLSTINDDVLTYGHIKHIDEIHHNNILVIERNDQRIYLRRYYG